MSSTRNINNQENYNLKQYSLNKERLYMPNSSFSSPTETMFPGNGLLPGKIANSQLSNNAIDIETFLFGIGSSNLVNSYIPVVPNIKPLKSLNMFNTNNVILPNPLVIEPGQRLRLFE